MRQGPTLPARRPAFYALRPGAWRDYVNLLHLPYLAWHLSFVVFGGSLSPHWHLDRLLWTLLAFALAVGLSAHALDELEGRPLMTHIPAWGLVVLGTLPLAGAVALGIIACVRLSPWMALFIAAGAFLLAAYNLELARGRFHNAFWFALGWGAFPALTAAWVQGLELRPAALLAALAAFLLSLAQRSLSVPVRQARRHPTPETEAPAYSEAVRGNERALLGLSIALPMLAAALALATAGM